MVKELRFSYDFQISNNNTIELKKSIQLRKVTKLYNIRNQYLPSPLHEIHDTMLHNKNVRLFIKRDDMIHPDVSGNKWRKLLGNIEHINNERFSGIVTFGGAFSNHIYATAAVAKLLELNSVGIIRGEFDENNPTLAYARNQGMKLHFVSRSEYREKENSPTIKKILNQYPSYHLVPEGGSNAYAFSGLKTLAKELKSISYDILTVAAGTGTTSLGMIKYQDKMVEVYPVLKGDFLKKLISEKIENRPFKYIDNSHLGGYAKTNDSYILWLNKFYHQHGIKLDPIYNGKVLYQLFSRIQEEKYLPGTNIVHIHTGGLQGIAAYNYLATKSGKPLLEY